MYLISMDLAVRRPGDAAQPGEMPRCTSVILLYACSRVHGYGDIGRYSIVSTLLPCPGDAPMQPVRPTILRSPSFQDEPTSIDTRYSIYVFLSPPSPRSEPQSSQIHDVELQLIKAVKAWIRLIGCSGACRFTQALTWKILPSFPDRQVVTASAGSSSFCSARLPHIPS